MSGSSADTLVSCLETLVIYHQQVLQRPRPLNLFPLLSRRYRHRLSL